VRALAKILTYLVIVALLTALLSPPLYWILHGALHYPFHRYFTRVLQIAAIVLLVPLLLWLRIKGVREFGLEKNFLRWRDLLAGLALALVPLVALEAAYLAFDVYRLNPQPAGKLARILGSAVFVAALEEFLFRGVLLGLAAKAWGRWPAALGISAIFAAVHFLKPTTASIDQVQWWSGFAQLGAVFSSISLAAPAVFAFVSLLAAGCVLAMAALATRSLWLPIGLHAGWIFGQQGFQWLAKFRPKPGDALLPWVGPNQVSGAVPTGLLPLAVLLLTLALVWLYLRYGRSGTARGV